MNRIVFTVLTTCIFAVVGVAEQDSSGQSKQNGGDRAESCPLHAEHMRQQTADQRFLDMNRRGVEVMGFDQRKTIHHFRSFSDGGAIEVTVKNLADTRDLQAIRNHLSKIARDFAVGDFSSPVMTHNEMPTGASDMQRLRAGIKYDYEEVENGARVRMITTDPHALRAIHEFLNYQAREHGTGD